MSTAEDLKEEEVREGQEESKMEMQEEVEGTDGGEERPGEGTPGETQEPVSPIDQNATGGLASDNKNEEEEIEEKEEMTEKKEAKEEEKEEEKEKQEKEEEEETEKQEKKEEEEEERKNEKTLDGELAVVDQEQQAGRSKEEGEESTAEGPTTTTATEGEATTDQEKKSQPVAVESVGADLTQQAEKPHTPSQSSKHKDRGKHKDRKKKKSKGVPKLRRRSSKAEAQRAEQYLHSILLSYFQALDQENSGLLPADTFWEVVLSQELNLQLTEDEVTTLQTLLNPDGAGVIPYAEFVSSARSLLATVYKDRTDTEALWVEVHGIDGTTVMLNKKTGAVRDLAEGGFDLFEDTFRDLFNTADTENKGHITTDDFTKMLLMQEMTNYLQSEDIEQMTQQFPDGKVTFAEFYPIAKELILRVYRSKDPSDSEWLPLSSPRVGIFWFNKFTGETRREVSPQGEREQELVVISQLNAEIEQSRLQLDQERLQGRELQNQLALANEELERMAMQLDETGRQLDEAHNELALRETEAAQFNAIIEEKDQFIIEQQTKVASVEQLELELRDRERVLRTAQDTVAEKELSLTARDDAIADLQHQSSSVVDQLKSARGVIDARESTIEQLQEQLASEQKRVSELQSQVPLLENRLVAVEDDLRKANHGLEEKSAALSQTRRSLRNARERNKELEVDMEKMSAVNDKLKNAECEIRTLKSFVMSKTAMVERRKAEIMELKMKLAEAESKDNRRAVILADVLEKTARTYQQQLATTITSTGPAPFSSATTTPLKVVEETDRPCSAPLLPLEEVPLHREEVVPRGVPHGFSLHSTMPAAMWPRCSPPKKSHLKARTVPKLPPLRRRPAFIIPTEQEIASVHRRQDAILLPHAATNPNCQCQLCLLTHPSAVATSPSEVDQTRRLVTGLVGGQGGVAATRYQQQLETNERELQVSQQIRIGQRVLIQTKKSVYDLEPQKLTGIVKYIGKIDSEFIDNRIYVGVKLDEPVGNTDGVFKGKRYFSCPPKHGKMVRITNIIAVLPSKSVVYRPVDAVHKSKQASPYAAPAHSPHKKGTAVKV